MSLKVHRGPYPSPPRPGPKLHRGKIHQPLRPTTQSHWRPDSSSSLPASSLPAPKHCSPAPASLGQLIQIIHVALTALTPQRTFFLSTLSKLLLDHDPPPTRTHTHTHTARLTTAFTTASTTEQHQQTTLLQTKNYYHRYQIAQYGVHFRASARGRPR